MATYYPSRPLAGYNVYIPGRSCLWPLTGGGDAEPVHLQIEPTPGESKRARGLGDIAGGPLEHAFDHIALDALDGGPERDVTPRAPRRGIDCRSREHRRE